MRCKDLASGFGLCAAALLGSKEQLARPSALGTRSGLWPALAYTAPPLPYTLGLHRSSSQPNASFQLPLAYTAHPLRRARRAQGHSLRAAECAARDAPSHPWPTPHTHCAARDAPAHLGVLSPPTLDPPPESPRPLSLAAASSHWCCGEVECGRALCWGEVEV
jgi:hypothetical protein